MLCNTYGSELECITFCRELFSPQLLKTHTWFKIRSLLKFLIHSTSKPPCIASLLYVISLLWKTIFPNLKKSWQGLHFHGKRRKAKIARVFFNKPWWRSSTPRAVGEASPSSFPGSDTEHLSSKPPWLWTVALSICALPLFTWCIC